MLVYLQMLISHKIMIIKQLINTKYWGSIDTFEISLQKIPAERRHACFTFQSWAANVDQ